LAPGRGSVGPGRGKRPGRSARHPANFSVSALNGTLTLRQAWRREIAYKHKLGLIRPTNLPGAQQDC